MRLMMKKNGFMLLFSIITAFSFVGDASFSRLNLANPFRVLQILFSAQKKDEIEENRKEKEHKLIKAYEELEKQRNEQEVIKAEETFDKVVEIEEGKRTDKIKSTLGFQYRKEDGFLASGYVQIGEECYYFDEKSRYCITNQWKKIIVEGNEYSFYFGPDGKQLQDVSAMIGSTTPLLLKINTKTNRIIVFTTDKENNYRVPVKVMLCSAGKLSTPTKKGIYKLKKVERWHRLNGNVYGQYCCRITQHYLIHSVFYSQNQNPETLNVREYNKLGENASHGCVRVCVADAKWIYEQVDRITVWTTDEDENLPLKDPLRLPPIIINGNKGIDPTDPNVNP